MGLAFRYGRCQSTGSSGEQLARSVKRELLKLVQGAELGERLEASILDALGGPTRVLPEGKPSPSAALTSLSYCTASGGQSLEVVPAIAAMELLMAACELVDDVQDEEMALPCDRTSLGGILDTTSTMLVLCHAAIGKLADRGFPPERVVRAFQVIDSLTTQAMRGQSGDLVFETQAHVSLEESYRVSALKSASLVKCAAEVGASLGTDNPHDVALHGRFGWHFGLAMQIMNDVSAIWPGGPEKSDLRLRKKTLPIVFALNIPSGLDPHADLVRRYYRGEAGGAEAENDVKEALWKCGAIHYAWAVAAREKAQAKMTAQVISAGTQRDCPLFRLLD